MGCVGVAGVVLLEGGRVNNGGVGPLILLAVVVGGSGGGIDWSLLGWLGW